jgi:O-antigen ligase/NADH:ubiquinone oxidoreductase subunit K
MTEAVERAHGDRPGALGGVIVVGAVAAVGLVTVVAGVLSGGNPVLTLAPTGLLALAYLVWKSPLRLSTTALVFLLLALEVTGDAAGLFRTPLMVVGDLLSDSSGNLTHVRVAVFEVLVALLLAMVAYRRSRRLDVDGPGHVPTASAVRDLILLYLVGLLYAEALGVVHGVGIVPWKARYFLHVPLFVLLFQAGYRNPGDFALLGKAVVAAAHVKALLAVYVQMTARALTGGELAYATNHGDSVLFVMAIVVVLTPALERTRRGAGLRAALLIPLPLWALFLNGRRIAWAMLAFSLLFVFLVTPWRASWKRTLGRVLLVGAPLILLYVGVGWSSASGAFGPVNKFRTMLDSKDPSTYWREVEAWNIATTLRDHPFVGIGLGGEYVESMFNDDISTFYPDFRGWPHNTVLGLLLYAGVPGFTCLWLLYPLAIFLAVRAYRRAERPRDRAAALSCLAAVVCAVFMAWGDTGLHFNQTKLALAGALALASKLAVSTGAWPARRRPAAEG